MDLFVSSLEYIGGLFDVVDLVVLGAIAVFAVGYYVRSQTLSASSKIRFPESTPIRNGTLEKVDRSFLGRMKSEDRQILILFGSQTGTAEELAGRMAKDLSRFGKKPLLMDPEEIEAEDLPKIVELTDPVLLLFVATYGEGDPTDNAQALHEFFTNADCDLAGLKYVVFGLGNKTYEHFNAVGKFFDKRLEELGAERVFEMGIADDDANLEEDFMRWRELFLPTLAQRFSWDLVGNGALDRQYRLEIIGEPTKHLFTGEFGRIGAYERQRPPFEPKNPFLSTIAVNRELHLPSSDRSCRHVEFSVDKALIRYEAGDHIAIFPTNDLGLVDVLASLLEVDLDTVFKLVNTDVESTKKHPFPCPCTFRTALTHYVDICSPVKSHVLKALVEFSADEATKDKLSLLSTASEDGLHEYAQFIVKERRNIVDVLQHFPSCKPPLDLLLELLPRLQARYYSISSSPRIDASRVAVTAVVLRYQMGDRLVKGVCTNFLSDRAEGASAPVFIRKSTLRLPHRLQTPVVMIGPGTGLAPFRGFLHERVWHKKQGKEVGEMHLFFGCRHPEHDHIYKDEMEEFEQIGLLTQHHVAYSRFQSEKVYVQHKLWENRQRIWELVQEGAAVYVCGDARNMARDVQNMFYKIFAEVGGLSEQESQKMMKDMEKQRRYQADVWS
uniref:NADPH--cytochrome P450 reductase n=1 Tax=Globodera pallida TaxID=36090 RepID=A0A183C8J4_GLOPA